MHRPSGRTITSAVTSGAQSFPKLPLPVFLYLLAVLAPLGFSLGPLALNVLRLFLLVVTVPLVLKLFSGKYGKIFATDYLFVIHLAWATLALAINNPEAVVQQFGSVGMEFLGGYAVGRAYIRSSSDFIALCKMLVLLTIAMLPIAIFETLTGRPIIVEFVRSLPVIKSVPVVTYEKRMGLERVQAIFEHPIHYGLFCSIIFSMCFVALRGAVSDSQRYMGSILVAFSTFLSLSSGALLAILLQFALIMWATVFANMAKRWWLLLGLFALAYVAIDLLSNRTPIKVFMSYATFSAHTAYWRAHIFEWGMVNVWANPGFGIGMNDWIRPHWMETVASIDNFWLLNAMKYGILGFVFVAFGYGYAIYQVMKRNFDNDPTLLQLRRAWVFTFLGLSFTLCTVHVWGNIYSFTFFMFASGMWFITAETSDETATQERSITPRGRFSPTGGSRSAAPTFQRQHAQDAPSSKRSSVEPHARHVAQVQRPSRTTSRTKAQHTQNSRKDKKPFSRF